jgi:hypothetical protein
VGVLGVRGAVLDWGQVLELEMWDVGENLGLNAWEWDGRMEGWMRNSFRTCRVNTSCESELCTERVRDVSTWFLM